MAQALTWSQQALEDIDAIASYVSKDSFFYATQIVERIIAIEESLVAHPLMGRIVPELNDANVRERFVYSYRVIYEIVGDTVHVLAVIHGKRLLESIERFKP
jgi:addiction module RelE/StbE family toxin